MSTKKDIFANKEEKWNFIIALIVISLFASISYLFLSRSKEVDLPANTTEVINSGLKETKEASTPAINKNTENSINDSSSKNQLTTIKIEDAYQNGKDSAVVISDLRKNALPETITFAEKKQTVHSLPTLSQDEEIDSVLNSTEAHFKQSETQEEYIDTNPTDTSNEQETAVKTAPDEVEGEVKEELVEEKTSEKVQETTTNDSFDCVIIVGAFKDKNNQTSVVGKLKSMGYDHVEGLLKNQLNYVGVPVSCNDKLKKKQLLQELNEAFSISSWVKKR